jgi:hypothetical protein
MESLMQTIQRAIDNNLANVHTATIAKITAVNDKTINCKPVINRTVNNQSVELPEFIEVPPVFLSGGNSYHAFPLSVGDDCLLIFTERCFDNWYVGKDYLSPPEVRMFDYSDGFAIVGIKTASKAITIPKVIQMTGDTNQDGNYTHQGDRAQTGDYILTGDQIINGDLTVNGDITVIGNVTVTGTIAAGNFTGLNGGDMTSTTTIRTTKDVIASGISLNSHTHSGVETGSGSTGGPK